VRARLGARSPIVAGRVDTLHDVPYDTQQARQELLDDIADAVEQLGIALTALGAAYGQLDEDSADRLEDSLFRPVQAAYGRARRTHSSFANRVGLGTRDFAPPDSAGLPSQGVRGFLDRAVDAVEEADRLLADLQDSMRPVEVGDPELRAGLADVRAQLREVRSRAAAFMRTFGR
jgi:hypothetical protein